MNGSAEPTPWIDPCTGCGDSDCPEWGLCDVDLSVVDITTEGYDNIDEAIREIADLHDTGEMLDNDVVAEQRGIWTEALQTSALPPAARSVALDLFAGGDTITEAAAKLGATPLLVVRRFTRLPLDVVLEIEAELRGGAESYVAIERATGVDNPNVQRIAELLHLKPRTAARQQAGGGYRWTAEQVAQVLECRSRGEKFKDIAEAMGLRDAPQAKDIWKRHRHKAGNCTSTAA